MVDKQLGVETISELQIWIEGKFALIAQMQETAHTDLTTVRRTVHELANHIAVLMALNLPEKLAKLEEADKLHEVNIQKFFADQAERKGMLTALKAIYIVGGAMIGGLIAVAFQLYKIFQQG